MKINFMSRLLLLVTSSLVLYSCRNDQFLEQETYNNSSKYQLTSKTISLNESKHKAILNTELQKVQTELKNVKTNVFGKTLSYGNGISIDTDHVIYIENGPNYHNYTFRIIREGTTENTPVENLVLTPLPDGSYKEILVTYNLTTQEKEHILLGNGVDTKGKVTITDVAKGTYNGNGQLAKYESCGWVEETYWEDCSSHEHNQSNWQDWGSCTADVKPKVYTISVYKCEYTGDGGSSGGGGAVYPGGSEGGGGGVSTGEGGSTGDGSTGTGTTEPCNGTGGLTQPLDPTLDPGDGSCTGVPTLPNLGELPRTPCQKTQATLANPQVQTKINALKSQAQLPSVNPSGGEKGFKMKTDGSIEDASQNAKHEVDYGDLSSYYGAYHNHTLRGVHMLSHKDIDILLGLTTHNSTVGPGNAFHGMIAAEEDGNGGFTYLNYVVRFNGTYQDAINFNFTNDQLDGIGKDYEKIVDKLKNDALLSNDNGFTLNQQGLQKLFFEAAKLMGMQNNVILQRVDDDGVKTIQLNSDGSTTAVPCP